MAPLGCLNGGTCVLSSDSENTTDLNATTSDDAEDNGAGAVALAFFPFCDCVAGFKGVSCEVSPPDQSISNDRDGTAEIDPLWALALLML